MSHFISNSNIESRQEIWALVNNMGKLVVAELLVIINVCLLQHFSPNLLNLFISQLSLCKETGGLKKILKILLLFDSLRTCSMSLIPMKLSPSKS